MLATAFKFKFKLSANGAVKRLEYIRNQWVAKFVEKAELKGRSIESEFVGDYIWLFTSIDHSVSSMCSLVLKRGCERELAGRREFGGPSCGGRRGS